MLNLISIWLNYFRLIIIMMISGLQPWHSNIRFFETTEKTLHFDKDLCVWRFLLICNWHNSIEVKKKNTKKMINWWKYLHNMFFTFPLFSVEVSIKFQQIQMILFWHENPIILKVDTSLIALQKSVWNFSLQWDLISYDSLIRGFASQGK